MARSLLVTLSDYQDTVQTQNTLNTGIFGHIYASGNTEYIYTGSFLIETKDNRSNLLYRSLLNILLKAYLLEKQTKHKGIKNAYLQSKMITSYSIDTHIRYTQANEHINTYIQNCNLLKLYSSNNMSRKGPENVRRLKYNQPDSIMVYRAM